MSVDYEIRNAFSSDFGDIARIYNDGIDERKATFEVRHRNVTDIQRWLDGIHPTKVAVMGKSVVAFATTSEYRDRECYSGIAEFSLYVGKKFRGNGIGRALMKDLISDCERAGFWKLVSRVFVENTASRKMLQSIGFREVGTYVNHARLDGMWRNVVIVEFLIMGNIK